MPATNEPKKRILPPVTLDASYKLCQQMVRDELNQYRWTISNLPRDMRPFVYSVLALTLRSRRLADIHISKTGRQEMLDDLREDMRNNFMEEESTDQFPALLDTMTRHAIPQQYLQDIVASADMCLHIDRFQNFDQWLQLGYRIGGGTLMALISIWGAEKQGYEESAMCCGQAIYLTHLLADILDEIQKMEHYLPAEDLQSFNVDLDRHNPTNPQPELLRLIRLMVERIENLYERGGQVVNHLSLDGQRVMKTIITVGWNLLMKIKAEPENTLQAQINLSKNELMRLKLKHMMGLEGGVRVIPGLDDHH